MQDYFRYYLPGPASLSWGIAASGVGFTRIKPGLPYPPGSHPQPRYFSWQSGRVLDEYQLVYISQGGGCLESKESKPQPISAGTLFILFPGVWHRYRPDPALGWVEHWIELQGGIMDRLWADKLIEPGRLSVFVEQNHEIPALFEQCHYLARATPPGYPVLLATIGLQILAQALSICEASGAGETRVDQAARKAQALLAEAPVQSVNMQALASGLGLSYSSFRRAFKAQTGHSPKQYQLQLRLRRVKDLLRSSDKTIAEIADLLGFDSPYHLSNQFKASTGQAPKLWREKALREIAGQDSGSFGTS